MTTGLKPLTDRQAEVYRAMVRYFLAHGRMPTIRQVGRDIGIRSQNGVLCHFHFMVKKGYLVRVDEQGSYEYTPWRFAGLTFQPVFDGSPAGTAAMTLWREAREEECAKAKSSGRSARKSSRNGRRPTSGSSRTG